MILIPEQISSLIEEEKRLRYENQKAISSAKSENYVVSEMSRTFNFDTENTYNLLLNDRRIKEINNLLSECEYLINRNLDSIEVGTKFELYFDDTASKETFIMIEKSIGTVIPSYISKESPIGQAIVGKKEGETFSYQVNGNIISGIITKIETDKKQYINFIRERPYENRQSYKSKKLLKHLLNDKDLTEEEQQELDTHLYITTSQYNLLKTEIERLKNLKDNTRLITIKKILKNPVAIPEDNGSIGIGSKFSIMLFGEEKTEFKRVEMINRAVSTELDCNYVERIDNLGSVLYGLRENDEFFINVGKKSLTGIVYDIDNKIDSYTTNSTKKYQSSKKQNRFL